MEKKNKKNKGTFFLVAALVFAAVFVFSSIMLGLEVHQMRKEADAFLDLKVLKIQKGTSPYSPEKTGTTDSTDPAPSPSPGSTSSETDPSDPSKTDPDNPSPDSGSDDAPVVQTPLEWQVPLIERNPDYFAWITIPGTNIDYPVMYSPDRPNYYLSHAFDGSSAKAGVPYLSENCDPNGSYYLVYGHRLRIGTMFSHLVDYEKQSFWESHKEIQFDTRYEERRYVIVFALKTRVFNWGEKDVFKYYNYTSLSSEETFNDYMRQARENALYDTGINVSYGDEILVLSTCYRYIRNGRFVIIAKRIS